jgi:hypothetical protein
VIRKIIWLLPPMASAVVPNQPSMGRRHAVLARGQTHQPKVLREVVFLHTQSTTKPLPTLSRPNRSGLMSRLSTALHFCSGVSARASGGRSLADCQALTLRVSPGC